MNRLIVKQVNLVIRQRKAAYNVYHIQLYDETEIEASDKWFQDVELSYIVDKRFVPVLNYHRVHTW